jgi:hypothetical protein
MLAATPDGAFAAPEKKTPAPAADARQEMKYDVYAGGFHVVAADLTVDLAKKDSYLLRLGAKTYGVLAKLAPWNGVFQTNGWYDKKKSSPQPEKHFSDTTFRDERELAEFLYNKNGSFRDYRMTKYENNKEEPAQEKPDPALSQNTTDVLSATLKVMNTIAKSGKCEGSDEIFDGARRYTLIYANSAQTELEPSDLNVYAGPATKCTVEVKPISGKWHKKPRGWMSIQEQGRERGKMPTIWFASMAEGEPAVPVKIQVKTEYGALMMHLTHYKGAGKALNLAQN